MSDKVRQLAPKIWEEIQKANNILLHCHPGPDADSLGSVLALSEALENIGKKATIIAGDSPKPENLSVLPGFEKIVSSNYFEINPDKFDLFLILDSASKGLVSSKQNLEFPQKMTTIIIDHHPTNTEFGLLNLVDSSYPATCQIIADLLELWKLNITSQMATDLFVGIYFDTGGFKYYPVSASTLETAAKLAKINPNFPQTIFDIENCLPPDQITYMKLALENVELYFNNQVALSFVSHNQLTENKISPEIISSDPITNLLKAVPGQNISVSLIEKYPQAVSISFRTRDQEKFDVSKIATSLGGGGHKGAAGANINKPLGEARKILLEALQKTFPTLGNP